MELQIPVPAHVGQKQDRHHRIDDQKKTLTVTNYTFKTSAAFIWFNMAGKPTEAATRVKMTNYLDRDAMYLVDAG